MQLAQVEDGVVVNIIDVDPKAIPPEMADWPKATQAAKIGGGYNGKFSAPPAPDPAEMLAQERAAMSCTPLQGKLALGEDAWAQVETMLAEPETPFAMRVAITSAVQWDRTSQMMDELAWLMGLTDEEVDDLFRAAMQVTV